MAMQGGAREGRRGPSSWGTRGTWRWARRAAPPPTTCPVARRRRLLDATLMSPSSPISRGFALLLRRCYFFSVTSGYINGDVNGVSGLCTAC
jgi:hypothetical protein